MTVSVPSLGSKSAIRPARLQRHRHLALESFSSIYEVGLGERLGGFAFLDREIERDVVGELGMDDGRAARRAWS